jgi:hypothetical protein
MSNSRGGVDLQNGFGDLVAKFGIEDADSPARTYARRAAAMMRAHGVGHLKDLPPEVLQELAELVANGNGSEVVPLPRPPVARPHRNGKHTREGNGQPPSVGDAIEVLDQLVVFRGDRVLLVRRNLRSLPTRSVRNGSPPHDLLWGREVPRPSQRGPLPHV